MNIHHRPIDLMAQAVSIRPDPVPDAIEDVIDATPVFAISRTEFLLSLPFGLRFHYRMGDGVAIDRDAGVTDNEVDLFLSGSVTGAVAWMNGFVPLHASAVVLDGRVHAFTGASGAGKSTLVAALAKRGLPVFADDVLILDLNSQGVSCLPGHKKLKLWGDALGLTRNRSDDRVRPGLDKFFLPIRAAPQQPMPLGTLWFLDDGARLAPIITDIRGAEAFRMVPAAYYRPRYCDAVMDRAAMFRTQAAIAGACRLRRFDRPKRADLFDLCADRMAEVIRGAS